MNLFCSQINNALKQNFIFLDLRFKRKYLYILNELLKLNLIKSFNYNNKSIRVYLKYYKNKPIFYLDCKLNSSKKSYFNFNKIQNMCLNKDNVNIDIFSSDRFFFSEKNVLFLNNIGGLYVLKVMLII